MKKWIKRIFKSCLVIIGVFVVLSIVGATIAILSMPSVFEERATIEQALTNVLVSRSFAAEILEGQIAFDAKSYAHPFFSRLIEPVFAQEADVLTMQDIAAEIRTQWEILEAMDPSAPLAGFHSSVEGWFKQQLDAAETIAAGSMSNVSAVRLWERLPYEPTIFTTSFAPSRLKRLLNDTVDTIAEAKAVGDQAVAEGRREDMRSVAATIQTQSYWLKNQPFYSSTICPRNRGCYPDLPAVASGVVRSAWSYVAEEPNAAESWIEYSQALGLVIEGGGTSIEGLGITPGGEDVYVFDDVVLGFFDECSGKDGVIGGTGGMKVGLPTTEYGYTCWSGIGNQCWDFQTFSQKRYLGGNNTECPEPPAPAFAPTPVPTPTPRPAAVIAPVSTPEPEPEPEPESEPEDEDVTHESIAGSWSGTALIEYYGSQNCKNYTFDWSVTFTESDADTARGQLYDSEGAFISNVSANWNGSTNSWNIAASNEIFNIGGNMQNDWIQGGTYIQPEYIPCDDVDYQLGNFYGSRK